MRRFIYDEPVSQLAVWSRRVAMLALVVSGYAVLMLRSGVQDWRGAVIAGAALTLIALAALLAIIAMVRIWNQGFKGVGIAAQTLVLVAAMLLLPGFYAMLWLTLPQLNDVTTDMENPPAFSQSQAALAARIWHVPPDVDATMRERQKQSYPAIKPLLLDLPPEDAFDLARKAAIALGWQIIESSSPISRTEPTRTPNERAPAGKRNAAAPRAVLPAPAPAVSVEAGRIEAIHRTRLLRFAEDITIRIRPRPEGSRIDLRAASRISPHDFGTSAVMIKRFADEMIVQETAK